MHDQGDRGLRISRATFLKGAAGALVGGGALAAGVGTAAAAPRRQAVTTSKVRDLTGFDDGQTAQYRMAATDLGIPVTAPNGRKLFVFGDTYESRATDPDDFWRSPVALYSDTTDLGGGVMWHGAVGDDVARQLWPYEHTGGMTVLPADALVVGDTIYLYAMVNQNFPTVTETQIWKSTDDGATWQDTGVRFNDDDARFGSNYQCITWARGDDGFVYVFSTKFGRGPDSHLFLSRVPVDRIEDVTAYQAWGRDQAGWDWGKPFRPVLEIGAFGELCLRPIGGKWVLTYLVIDRVGPRIEGILMNTPTDDLTTAYRVPLITGVGWDAENHAAGRVAQPYGGYIIPGSTLDDLHLAVSQWDTEGGDNWPYRVMQFRTTGFGS